MFVDFRRDFNLHAGSRANLRDLLDLQLIRPQPVELGGDRCVKREILRELALSDNKGRNHKLNPAGITFNNLVNCEYVAMHSSLAFISTV